MLTGGEAQMLQRSMHLALHRVVTWIIANFISLLFRIKFEPKLTSSFRFIKSLQPKDKWAPQCLEINSLPYSTKKAGYEKKSKAVK
jgi:hypothetical protein